MSRPSKIALLLVGLLGLFLIGLQIDDELSPESRQLIAVVEEAQAPSSAYEAYYYLSGISAPAEAHPVTRGVENLAHFEQFGKLKQDAEDLPLPDKAASLFCNLKTPDCFDQIMSLREQWAIELSKQEVLLKRYETFLNYEHFATPLKTLTLEYPFPSYAHLVQGNRLKRLSAISAAVEVDGDAGVSILLEDLNRLRRHLASADLLIHKMIFVSMIAEDLEALVKVYQRYTPQKSYVIKPLAVDELGLYKVFTREFYFFYTTLLNIDHKQEYFSESENVPNWCSGWCMKLIYKPNMTINEIAHRYQAPLQRAQMNSEQFAQTPSQEKLLLSSAITLDRARNWAGAVLAAVGSPNFDSYIARLHDLNAKVVLASYVLSGQSTELKNPYGDSYAIQKEERSVCMDGPLKDERNLRCVSW